MKEKKVKAVKKEEQEAPSTPISELITPVLNRVLVRLITESNEYVPGISRLNKGVEMYVFVESVGNGVNSCKPGQYAITRPMMKFDVFPLFGQEYSIINEGDLLCIVDSSIIKQFSTAKLKEINKPKIDLEVN